MVEGWKLLLDAAVVRVEPDVRGREQGCNNVMRVLFLILA